MDERLGRGARRGDRALRGSSTPANAAIRAGADESAAWAIITEVMVLGVMRSQTDEAPRRAKLAEALFARIGGDSEAPSSGRSRSSTRAYAGPRGTASPRASPSRGPSGRRVVIDGARRRSPRTRGAYREGERRFGGINGARAGEIDAWPSARR